MNLAELRAYADRFGIGPGFFRIGWSVLRRIYAVRTTQYAKMRMRGVEPPRP